MKKIICLTVLAVLFFLSIKIVWAEGCETGERVCTELKSCAEPCIRVVTRQGSPGGRSGGVPGYCACQLPNQAGTVPLGGSCKEDTDCALPGKYCWGEFNQTPICHKETRSEGIQERQNPFDPTCPVDDDPKGGIDTALGCIPANSFNSFTAWLLGRLVFIATGIAFILLVIGALQILTSAGNPEKVKAGGELITSTIAGLLLIILSVFLLKLIGVDILHIPGFGQ
jgi:hypothetical protein